MVPENKSLIASQLINPSQDGIIKKNKIQLIREQQAELKRQEREEKDWARQERTEELRGIMV